MPLVTRNHPKLTLEGARAVLAAAERRAIEIGVPMDIAVVDDGGQAESAAIRRMATGPAMEGDKPNLVLSLGLAVASHGRQTPIRGGIPLLVDGQCVGAIGVSSGTEDQDADVARAGAAALEKT